MATSIRLVVTANEAEQANIVILLTKKANNPSEFTTLLEFAEQQTVATRINTISIECDT